jgi:hypothetical protein
VKHILDGSGAFYLTVVGLAALFVFVFLAGYFARGP